MVKTVIFSVKLVPKTNAEYLELQMYICRQRNCQIFAPVYPRQYYCAPLPLDAINFENGYHTQDPVSCAFDKNRAANICATYTSNRTFTHNKPRFH
jgi:hypothetical protein